jgi:hypothetical protein
MRWGGPLQRGICREWCRASDRSGRTPGAQKQLAHESSPTSRGKELLAAWVPGSVATAETCLREGRTCWKTKVEDHCCPDAICLGCPGRENWLRVWLELLWSGHHAGRVGQHD